MGPGPEESSEGLSGAADTLVSSHPARVRHRSLGVMQHPWVGSKSGILGSLDVPHASRRRYGEDGFAFLARNLLPSHLGEQDHVLHLPALLQQRL